MSAATKAPIRFVGHFDLSAEGKYLWEILSQLRNMGVGRYVTKNEWCMKWPDQSSYLKIIKALPEMDRWQHRGNLFAEWTFRGRNLGMYEFSKDLGRSDWKLIHKMEESKFLENENRMHEINLPESFPLPPLYVHMGKMRAEKEGKEWQEEQERAPLELCIDPQFENLMPFIRQVKPKKMSHSVYEEIDPEVYLDWYGKLLPPKVEAWTMGPAAGNWTLQSTTHPEY